MATSSKRPIGIGIVGFVFAVTGFIFVGAGNTAIGIAMFAVAVVFIAAGVAAARKAASPIDRTATAPPPEEGSGHAEPGGAGDRRGV